LKIEQTSAKEGITYELRGFAPIGIMEQWNCGMTGLKKTEFKAQIFALIFLI